MSSLLACPYPTHGSPVQGRLRALYPCAEGSEGGEVTGKRKDDGAPE
ncbi:hypothetical protein OPW19_05300 [Vibrio europaeus]|nr:hypothetical protein [Vibrio europaeus]MDC5819241.1 hypothetical protein [Vibrio europaeus]